MKRALLICMIFCATGAAVAADCSYVEQNIVFENMYARLVNRGPNMLAAYGTVTNNDQVPHTLVAVATPKAKESAFHVYRQIGGSGNVTMQPKDSIDLPPQGGSYTWRLGGPHIMLMGFKPKDAYAFGTQYDPESTILLKFTFADGCTAFVEQVPVKDRMQE